MNLSSQAPEAQPKVRSTDADRWHLAMEASWEIDALTDMVTEMLAKNLDPELPEILVIRGAVVRINTLNACLMFALDDDMMPTETLRQRVTGVQQVAKGAH